MSGDHDHRQGCAAGICLGFSPPVFCLRSRMHIPLKPSRWLHCCYFLHLFFLHFYLFFSLHTQGWQAGSPFRECKNVICIIKSFCFILSFAWVRSLLDSPRLYAPISPSPMDYYIPREQANSKSEKYGNAVQ